MEPCDLMVTRVTQPGATGIQPGSNRDPGPEASRGLRIHHHQTGGDDESLGGSENFCVGEWELLGNRRVSNPLKNRSKWKILNSILKNIVRNKLSY